MTVFTALNFPLILDGQFTSVKYFFYKSKIINMSTVKGCESVSDKFNAQYVQNLYTGGKFFLKRNK
jgi:hypothetical protein